jgi:COP9 signalosome complex subunit 1
MSIIQEVQGASFIEVGRYLINKLKSENRVSFYNELIPSISKKTGFEALPVLSSEELARWELQVKDIADNKEFKISQSKNAGLKDSYRVHLIELADFYLKTGDLVNAMKVLQRAKDVTVTADHQFELFSLMSLVSLYKKNISFAQNNAQKIIHLTGIPASQIVTSKIIMGLCNMQSNTFKTATEYFLGLEGENNVELASNTDLAVYLVLCALASMDRSSIKTELMQSKSFLVFSEDESLLLDLVDSYLNCKFSKVMQNIEHLRSRYFPDYFIGKTLSVLCDEIKNKCLIQYLKAFKTVQISDLCLNFEMSENFIKERLSKLITEGKVDARIDAHEKVVRSRQIDQKNKLHKSVLNSAKDFVKTTQAVLLRISMIQEEVLIRPNRN